VAIERIAMAVVAAGMLIHASPASACQPAVDPGRVGRPALDPPEAGRVEPGTLVLDCDWKGCAYTATYPVELRAAARVSLATRHADELTITVDGAAIADSVGPGRHEVAIRARLPLAEVGECFRPGILARHPWLGAGRPPSIAIVLLEPGAEERPRVRRPVSWNVWLGRPQFSSMREGEEGYREVRMDLPGSRLLHGGPLLLAGIASGDGRSLRVRAGWEIAAPPSLVLSAAVDSDLSSLTTLAATAEAVSQAWVLPISMSAGFGPIVRLAPDARPGGRALVSAAVGPARVVLSTDAIWSDEELAWSVAILGGLSF
jgi:hypothetical protein